MFNGKIEQKNRIKYTLTYLSPPTPKENLSPNEFCEFTQCIAMHLFIIDMRCLNAVRIKDSITQRHCHPS